jgi:hypothetical protein
MLNRYRPLIPALVLLLGCLGTLLNVVVNNTTADGYYYALTTQQYGGFVAVAVLLGSFFWFPRYYKYALAFCCLLALCSIINFLPGQLYISIGIDELHLKLGVDGLLLGALVYSLYHRRVNAWLTAAVRPPEHKIAQAYRDEVAEFKARFGRKPTEELQQIITAKKLVPAALAAAQQLLRERQASVEQA